MPEIIEEIVKSELKRLEKPDKIRNDSDSYAKTHGNKYDLIPCDKSDYENIIWAQKLKSGDFYRIRALKSFSDVKKGDIGGIIDETSLLSHKGNCWIYNNAIATNKSYVIDDAIVKDNSVVDESFIENESKIINDCFIKNSTILDKTTAMDDSTIDSSNIDGASEIKDFSYITNSICRDLHIEKHVSLFYCTVLSKNKISGVINLWHCSILDNAHVTGWFNATNCRFSGDAEINLDIDINDFTSHIIGLNAKINSDKDFLSVHGFGINRSPITFFNCIDDKMRCIIDNDFCGELPDAKNFVMENSIEEYNGEFDDLIEYAKKKLNLNEEKYKEDKNEI